MLDKHLKICYNKLVKNKNKKFKERGVCFMTKREVFTKAMEMFPEGSEEREVMAKAIDQLNKKSSKPTKAQIENEGIKAQIVEYLGTEPQTAREIAEGVGITTNKAAALLRAMDGIEKIPGEKSKDAPKYRKAE